MVCLGSEESNKYCDFEKLLVGQGKLRQWLDALEEHGLQISALATPGEPLSPNKEAQVEGSPLITLKVRESEMHESGSPKDNAMYALKIGGLWILHMGDLGYGLSAQEMAPFVGRCDLLLALVGQTNTIPLEDLDFLIDHLKPKWIVPMHYLLWWPSKMRPLLIFAKYSVGAQRAAPALARHLLCPKTTLYSAGINKRVPRRSAARSADLCALEHGDVPSRNPWGGTPDHRRA